MKHETVINGKTAFCEYDDYQDALFVTFDKEPPLSYYEELEDGLMMRRETETDRVVGFAIRNISLKLCRQYASELSSV